MSLVKIEWNPPDKQLRQFGWCALAALPIIAWMLLGWSAPSAWTSADALFFGVFAVVGALFAVLGQLWPASLKPIFLAATVVTIPIGIVAGEALLVVIWFLVFTPVALFFRLIGRDVLRRRFEPAAATYWTPKT